MMRTARWSILLGCSILLGAGACRNQDGGVSDNGSPTQTFATLEEAAGKAKQDLLSVLRAGKDFNMGVDGATVERSEPAKPVRRVELDFEKLLAAPPTATLESLAKEEKDIVLPLVVDGRVPTVVEVRKDASGWRVVGLGGKDIADELTAVRAASPESATAGVTLYEVPNLQTRVYSVPSGDSEVLFANYGDRFRVSQGVGPSDLLPVLKTDALEFQREYGETLKKQRLVR